MKRWLIAAIGVGLAGIVGFSAAWAATPATPAPLGTYAASGTWTPGSWSWTGTLKITSLTKGKLTANYAGDSYPSPVTFNPPLSLTKASQNVKARITCASPRYTGKGTFTGKLVRTAAGGYKLTGTWSEDGTANKSSVKANK